MAEGEAAVVGKSSSDDGTVGKRLEGFIFRSKAVPFVLGDLPEEVEIFGGNAFGWHGD